MSREVEYQEAMSKLNAELDERLKEEKAMTEKRLAEEKADREKVLQEKNCVEEKSNEIQRKQFADIIGMCEDETFCSICNEIFISPVTLNNCGHVYCSYCIEAWKKNGHNTCPNCRAKVKSQVKNLILNNLIERFFGIADDETKMIRERLIAERQKEGIRVVSHLLISFTYFMSLPVTGTKRLSFITL